jgi:hypothetical protein
MPQETELAAPFVVALLGGGRWARTHATVLCRVLPPMSEVLWVSRHNRSVLSNFLEESSFPPDVRFTLLERREEAFSRDPEAAIVATAPHLHFEDAMAALKRGVSVLVEKPLVLEEAHAQALVELANRNRLALGVGLTMMSTSYLPHFASKIQQRAVTHLRLRWFDPPFEIRGGEAKAADLTVSKVHDIFPHLWSILKVLRPSGDFGRFEVEPGQDGALSVRSLWGGTPVQLAFGRRGERRERLVEADFADGGSAKLDFATEPGTVVVDGKARAPDPSWERTRRPLATELGSFLRAARDGSRDWPLAASRCIGSVRGAVALNEVAQGAEAAALARCIAAHPGEGDAKVAAWLVDNLAPELAGRRRLTLRDADAIASLVREGFAALRSTRSCPGGALGEHAGSAFIAVVRERLGSDR